MAWKKVSIDVDGESIKGSLKLDETQLFISNIIDLGETIKVDKKEYKILSSSIDTRDNKLIINLANASKPKKEKKSDDKQTKG